MQRRTYHRARDRMRARAALAYHCGFFMFLLAAFCIIIGVCLLLFVHPDPDPDVTEEKLRIVGAILAGFGVVFCASGVFFCLVGRSRTRRLATNEWRKETKKIKAKIAPAAAIVVKEAGGQIAEKLDNVLTKNVSKVSVSMSPMFCPKAKSIDGERRTGHI